MSNSIGRTSTWSTCLAGLLATALLLSARTAQASRAVGEADVLAPAEARAILKDASSRLKRKKATNEELRGALTALADAHARVGGTARDIRSYRRKAEAQLLKGLALQKGERRDRTRNVRTDVNLLAAKLLGATAEVLDAKGARALSLQLRKVIESFADDRKPDQWHAETLDASYLALAALNDLDTLRWMLAEHHHTKQREIPFLRAAHRAMVKFRDVPGDARFEICDTIAGAYSATELVARRGSSSVDDQAKKRFWDRVRGKVVPLLQHFAGKPEDEEGRVLRTVFAFERWLREHDDVRAAPWVDGEKKR